MINHGIIHHSVLKTFHEVLNKWVWRCTAVLMVLSLFVMGVPNTRVFVIVSLFTTMHNIAKCIDNEKEINVNFECQ